jgi:hypothetical protein
LQAVFLVFSRDKRPFVGIWFDNPRRTIQHTKAAAIAASLIHRELEHGRHLRRLRIGSSNFRILVNFHLSATSRNNPAVSFHLPSQRIYLLDKTLHPHTPRNSFPSRKHIHSIDLFSRTIVYLRLLGHFSVRHRGRGFKSPHLFKRRTLSRHPGFGLSLGEQ